VWARLDLSGDLDMAMSASNATTTGWIIFVAAVGMMFSMLAVDIASLREWSEMQTPVFVGTALGHVSAVIGAFIGGKLIPEQRDPSDRTRAGEKDDPK
jgi:uncharacterized membrane protein YadS